MPYALKKMRAGMTADKRIQKRKRVKNEMSTLFHTNQQKEEKCVVWCHRFVCLAYRGQSRQPTTDADKEELYQAGLREKEIEFQSLDLSQRASVHVISPAEGKWWISASERSPKQPCYGSFINGCAHLSKLAETVCRKCQDIHSSYSARP